MGHSSVFRAKYESTCIACGKTITVGSPITWNRRRGGRPRHLDCANAGMEPIPVETQPAIPAPAAVPDGDYDMPIPVETPVETPSNGHGNGSSAATPNTPMNEVFGAMAGALAPFIEQRLSVKVDKQQVQNMVNSSLAQYASSLQAEVTKRIHDAMEDARAKMVSRVEIKTPDMTEYKDCGIQHKLFPTLARLLASGQNVLLVGESASGKSTAAKNYATIAGKRFGTQSIAIDTPLSHVVGYMDAQGNYHSTMFREFYENGGIFLFDEFDNGSTPLLKTLNSAIENDFMSFPDNVKEPVKRHPDFLLIASSNTDGQGASERYNEANTLCVSIIDRFFRLNWPYDNNMERAVALSYNPNAGVWVDWVIKVREYLKERHPRLMATPRASIEGAKLLAQGFSTEEIATGRVFGMADAPTVTTILRNVPLPPTPPLPTPYTGKE